MKTSHDSPWSRRRCQKPPTAKEHHLQDQYTLQHDRYRPHKPGKPLRTSSNCEDILECFQWTSDPVTQISIAIVKKYKNLVIITFLLVWAKFPYWNSAEIRSDVIQFRIVKVGQKTFSLPAWDRECIKSKTRSGAPSVLPLVRIASLNSEGKTSIQFQMADLRCIAIVRWDSIPILTSNEESSVQFLSNRLEKKRRKTHDSKVPPNEFYPSRSVTWIEGLYNPGQAHDGLRWNWSWTINDRRQLSNLMLKDGR